MGYEAAPGGALKNFTKFTAKQLWRYPLDIITADCNFIKDRLQSRWIFGEICEIFQSGLFLQNTWDISRVIVNCWSYPFNNSLKDVQSEKWRPKNEDNKNILWNLLKVGNENSTEVYLEQSPGSRTMRDLFKVDIEDASCWYKQKLGNGLGYGGMKIHKLIIK